MNRYCPNVPPGMAFDHIFETLNNSQIIPAAISALMDSLCMKPASAYKAPGDLDELATSMNGHGGVK